MRDQAPSEISPAEKGGEIGQVIAPAGVQHATRPRTAKFATLPDPTSARASPSLSTPAPATIEPGTVHSGSQVAKRAAQANVAPNLTAVVT